MVELERDGVGARALSFANLTAAPSGAMRFTRWREIDLDQKLWVISGECMKAGKEHRVPLSDPALA